MSNDFISDLIQSVSSESKSLEGFMNWIEDLKESSKATYRSTFNMYSIHLNRQHEKTISDVVDEFVNLQADWKKEPHRRSLFVGKISNVTYESIVIAHLQAFINWSKVSRPCSECLGDKIKVGQCNICHRTGNIKKKREKALRRYITQLKALFRYFGLFDGLSERNIEKALRFPKDVVEEPHPFEKDMVLEILKEPLGFQRRNLYQVLASSGLRILEASALRKSNFVFVDEEGKQTDSSNMEQISIQTVPKYTKFGVQRTTYVSKEFTPDLIHLLNSTDDESPVLVKGKDPEEAVRSEEQAFKNLRPNLAKRFPIFKERYESGTHKITLHSFRSFFITQADKVTYGLGHSLAGHKKYMGQYNRLTAKEKLGEYQKAQRHLSLSNEIDTTTEKLLNEKQEQLDKLEKRQEETDVQLKQAMTQMEFIIKLRDKEIQSLKEKLRQAVSV